jgi:hypothetical protein
MDKTPKDETSEGLNQLLEIINAKGDEGELKQIVNITSDKSNRDKHADPENEH